MSHNCYSYMFAGCTALAEAPSLPATNLGENCYRYMFSDCTALAEAPSLPATTLITGCYINMFNGCTSLVKAPKLSATNLDFFCYSYMFAGCTALAEAPSLPATNLAQSCYDNMFAGCISLDVAPSLPAATLAPYCYFHMFNGCTSLVKAPSLPATTLADNCYAYMFMDCTALVTAPELPEENLATGCYGGMFYGCTSLAESPKLPATTLAESCYSSMFNGCTSLVEAPSFPATTLAERCYYRMFYGCTGIKLYKSEATVSGVSEEWSIPATANADGLTSWNKNMFSATGGDFTGEPEVGKTYYLWTSAVKRDSYDVAGTYQDGAAADTVYSVEITWGSMEFTYIDASLGTWNPATVQYEGGTATVWSCAADANKITVKNRSNTAVHASFSFTESITGISCGFYDTAIGRNTIAGSNLTLASAAPVGEATTGTEQIGTAYIQIISGALTSSQTDVKLGTITVEVN